jgi:WD40 repeat protein
MKTTSQRLSFGLMGLVLLLGAAACSGPGEKDKQDHAVKDDPTKPLRTAITGKVIAECLGHEDCVSGVAVSPDGKLAVSVGWDKTLRFWSVPDGKLIRTITAAKPPRESGCAGPPHFSADGKTVAALVYAEKTYKLCFWDAATGKGLPRSVPVEGRGGWTLSPDGERVASVIDTDCVRVWDTREGRLVREFRFLKEETVIPSALSFSPDGNHFAVGLGEGRGVVGIQRLQPPPQSLSSKVRVWDLRTGKLAFASETLPLAREARRVVGPQGDWEYVLEKQPYGVKVVAFSPDGTRLAAGGDDYRTERNGDNSIWVWDLATRKLVQQLPVGDPFVSDLAFSPDGHMLACGTGPGHKRPDPDVQVWNVASGKLLGSFQKHTGGAVTAVAWAKDGRTLVSCGHDRRVLIWRLEPR